MSCYKRAIAIKRNDSPKPINLPAEYVEFIRLFNDEKFFEAHEVLESIWRKEQSEARDFYHGLIQIAAVFVHIQKGTPEGGKELLKKAAKYLEPYQPVFMGLHLTKLLSETESALFGGGSRRRTETS